MKNFSLTELMSRVLIPLAAYLLMGLITIDLFENCINTTYFVIWGIMTGITFAIKDIFKNKTVTAGIVIYVVTVVLWLGIFAGENGFEHAIMFLLGIGAIALLRFLQKFSFIYMLLGYGALIGIVILAILQYDLSKWIVTFAILIFLNAVSETISYKSEKNINSFVIIYCLISVLTFWAPVSEEPYGWDFVINIINSVSNIVDRITYEFNYQWGDAGGDGTFRFGFTGYTDAPPSMRISFVDSDIEQLTLVGKRTKRNMYLKGNVNNYFDGDKWFYDLSNGTMDVTTDTLMALYAIFNYTQNGKEISRFADFYEQQVIFRNIKTHSLFYPVKTLNISTKDMILSGDNLIADEVKERGYSYSMQFLDLDYANPKMVEIMEKADSIKYDESQYNQMYEKLYEYYGIDFEKIPFETFCNKVETGTKAIKEQYTIVDDAVSEQVRQLAEQIIENCNNDYDKCKALERYLYRYRYNKVISIPENANILDWFLFEGKEGYCTHYATALVEMLRCVGIPARMVEGFLVEYKTAGDVYTYTVTAKSAHSWVEAYIEGFGWIRLEPTTPNAGNANTIWYQEDIEIEEEELFEELEEHKEEELRKEEEKNTWLLVIKLIGGMVVVILVICVGLFVYHRIAIQKSKNPNVIFDDIIGILKKQYRPRDDSETVSEYFASLVRDYNISEETQKNFGKLTVIMENYWYGNINPDNELIEYMKNFRDSIRK